MFSEKFNPKTVGILQMLLCASLWSIAGLLIKWIDANAFVIAGFRGLFAGATTLTYILIKKIPFRINKIVLLNAASMCILYLAFVTSNKLTTAANAIVLEFTTPLWIMLYVGIVKKMKLKKADIIAVIITMIGIALCFIDKMEGGYLLGNCIAIFAGLMMAVMYITVGECSEVEKFNGVMLGHFFTAIVGIPFMTFTVNHFDTRAALCLVILGVFQIGIPNILLSLSSKTCPPFMQSLLGAVEPLLNPVWVALFANEIPGVLAIIGGLLVIATVTIWCVRDNS